MDTEGFRQFLQGRRTPEDKLESFISIANKFKGVLRGCAPDASDVEISAMMLIREGLNTWDNFIALARYGQFLGNNEVYREAIALLDGSEVLDNLHGRLGKLVGEQKRDEILAGIELPPLGLPSSHKPRVMQAVMERLETMLDAETCDKLLSGSPAASVATPAANPFDFVSVFPGDILSDKPAVTFFGSTVDLDGNRLAVTSGYANATYVFEGEGKNWTYRFSLAPGRTTTEAWEDYAQIVKLSGDTVLLGTPGEFGNSAYVFNLCVPSSSNCK